MYDPAECFIRSALDQRPEPLDGMSFLKDMIRIGLDPKAWSHQDLRHLDHTADLVCRELALRGIRVPRRPGAVFSPLPDTLPLDNIIGLAEHLPPNMAWCMLLQCLLPGATHTAKQVEDGSSSVEDGLVVSHHTLFDFQNGAVYTTPEGGGGDAIGNLPIELVALFKRHTPSKIERVGKDALFWAMFLSGTNLNWMGRVQEGEHRIWPLCDIPINFVVEPNGLNLSPRVNLFRTKQVQSRNGGMPQTKPRFRRLKPLGSSLLFEKMSGSKSNGKSGGPNE